MFTDLIKYINFKNPLFQFFLFLMLFSFVSSADLLIGTINSVEKSQYISNILFVFLTSVTTYYILRYGFGLTMSNPVNFFVSATITYLLIHPTNPLWYFILAIIAIPVGKFIFRKNNLPVFNPTALALVITYLVTVLFRLLDPQNETLLVSWWGADLFQNITNNIPIVNILIPCFFLLAFVKFASAFKKLPYIISFFFTFLSLTFFFALMSMPLEKAFSLISLMLFNATAFCAVVMLPEPKTSPNFANQQIVVGIIAGISLWIFNNFLPAFPIDPLLNTIIVANIATIIVKLIAQTKRPPAVQPVTPTPVTPPPLPNPTIQQQTIA